MPVEVDEVGDFLVSHNIKDEFYFLEADSDPEILRAHLDHREYPYSPAGDLAYCADIYYSKNQSNDWARLASCKEVLHLLDQPGSRASTEDEVNELIDRIVLAPEFQDPIKDGPAVQTDRVAVFQALAVLFPWAARQVSRKAILAGKTTPEEIARIVDLPLRYVRLALSDRWEEFHAVLLEI